MPQRVGRERASAWGCRFGGWLKQGFIDGSRHSVTHPCGSRGCDSGRDRCLQGCNSCNSGGLAETKRRAGTGVIAMTKLTSYPVDLQLMIQQNDRGTHRQRQRNPPREQQRVRRVQLHLHQLRQQGKQATAASRSAHVTVWRLCWTGEDRHPCCCTPPSSHQSSMLAGWLLGPAPPWLGVS